MLYSLVVVGGLAVGLIVGRWWTLAAAVGIGAYIALVSEVDEVPDWFLGAGYGVLAAAGITLGVVVRSRLRPR